MSYVQSWLDARAITPEACAADGYEYPDLKAYVVEFAYDGMGNCLVWGVDGRVYFFDHEEGVGPLPCRTGIEELLQMYFDDPSIIRDDSAIGIEPIVRRAQGDPSVPEVLLERCALLPTWGNVALAIRCCERAAPTQHYDSLPPEWRDHAHNLREVVNLCRMAAIRGDALKIADSRRGKARCREAYESWRQFQQDPYDVRYLGGAYALALERLVDVCGNPEDYVTAKEVATRCGRMTIWAGIDLLSWRRAVIADLTLLLQQDLGTPGSTGQAVPEWFFSRA